jgi:pyrroloquinoline quinone biosynthesis protein B
VDHIAGLLSLRESQAFALYGTERVLSVLAENPVFEVLDRRIVPRRALPVDAVIDIADAGGEPTGIRIEAFDVPGKIALYLEDGAAGEADYPSDEGDTIGIRILPEADGAPFFYVPACARIDDALKARLDGAAGVLFDGTLYTDDEMIAAGVGRKTGARMGHIAMSGPAGAIEGLEGLAIGRRIFVHNNNTNPVLDEASPEYRAVRATGWEIAYDGMEITA